jgi:hypothetical protein
MPHGFGSGSVPPPPSLGGGVPSRLPPDDVEVVEPLAVEAATSAVCGPRRTSSSTTLSRTNMPGCLPGGAGPRPRPGSPSTGLVGEVAGEAHGCLGHGASSECLAGRSALPLDSRWSQRSRLDCTSGHARNRPARTPPPWAWWENEAPATRAASGPRQAGAGARTPGIREFEGSNPVPRLLTDRCVNRAVISSVSPHALTACASPRRRHATPARLHQAMLAKA